jgi:hypothetical protein
LHLVEDIRNPRFSGLRKTLKDPALYNKAIYKICKAETSPLTSGHLNRMPYGFEIDLSITTANPSINIALFAILVKAQSEASSQWLD